MPEPKRSSHEEANCKYKSGFWKWEDSQNCARKQSQPQAAVTSPQEGNTSTQQPAQSEAQRENAVRSSFSSYMQDEFPEEMSVGSNNAITLQMNARFQLSDTIRGREEKNKLRN